MVELDWVATCQAEERARLARLRAQRLHLLRLIPCAYILQVWYSPIRLRIGHLLIVHLYFLTFVNASVRSMRYLKHNLTELEVT
jgi:hypothetical protein